MTDEEKLAWCKERAAAEPWPSALASVIQDMQAMGIPLDPGLYRLGMGEAVVAGEAGVRRFIDGITLNGDDMDFEETAAGLRAWAEGDWIATAAVELLIGHETWVRRRDFLAACTDSGEGMTRIRWDDVREFAGSPQVPASTTEIAVLRLAVAIGSDDYRLASMGRANKDLITQAFATALGGAR